jgi:hypothetical protein
MSLYPNRHHFQFVIDPVRTGASIRRVLALVTLLLRGGAPSAQAGNDVYDNIAKHPRHDKVLQPIPAIVRKHRARRRTARRPRRPAPEALRIKTPGGGMLQPPGALNSADI